LVAAPERLTLEEEARTERAVETAGGMRARSAESVAARRSEAEDSAVALAAESVETQAGLKRVALHARRTGSGAV
jgi:hypothetical protein